MSGDIERTPPPSPLVGSVLAGRFRVKSLLGSGGMAAVYAAEDLATRKPLAIKLLRADVATNREAIERLRREGEVLSALKHPSIVSIETFGKLDDGTIFLAMEFLEGETLGAFIRRENKVDPSRLTPIVTEACAGLTAAHDKGIVHRDLKPDNVFLVRDGSGDVPRVKLLDFGISKVFGSDKLTQTGQVLGTPRYMAPEQLAAESDLDGRTDVYALGVILYEALAGSPPFLATSPSDLIIAILHGKVTALRGYRPDLSTELEAVIMRSMARAREARFASANALRDAWLEATGAGQPRREAPREGMSTRALGSMDEAAALLATLDAKREPSGKIKTDEVEVGTFSALAAVTPVDIARSKNGAPPPSGPGTTVPAGLSPPKIEPAPAGRVVQATRHSPAAAEPRPPQPVPMRERAEPRPPVAQPQPQPPPSQGRHRPQTEPYELPTQGGRTLLIAGGLFAGAISAAIAILVLQCYGGRTTENEPEARPRAAAEPAPPPAPAAPPAAPTPAMEATPVPTPSPAPALLAAPTSIPTAVTPPAISETPSSTRRDARRHAPADPAPTTMDVTPPTAPPSTEPEPHEPTASQLLGQARAAAAAGNHGECATLAAQAVDRGLSYALRVEGDCRRRDGDNEGALRAYRRFCQVGQDQPAIGEVRAAVTELGGTCP